MSSKSSQECRNERDVIAYQIAGELGQSIEFTIRECRGSCRERRNPDHSDCIREQR
jgi:hypothetical protein